MAEPPILFTEMNQRSYMGNILIFFTHYHSKEIYFHKGESFQKPPTESIYVRAEECIQKLAAALLCVIKNC